MSMNSCFRCGNLYDTDFQMEVDKDGNMICDRCSEEPECPKCHCPIREKLDEKSCWCGVYIKKDKI